MFHGKMKPVSGGSGCFIGRDDDSGYHHYVVDVEKEYIIKE